ncbi:MAG: hypothetical protein ACM3SV_07065 [Betaproteobacteria bacterium]
MTAPYVRTLSPFERMWLAAQASCGCTLVEGVGNLSASAFRAAVERATEVNPGSRLQLKGRGPWARWEAVDVAPSITEVDAGDWKARSAEGAPYSDIAHMDPRQTPSTSYVIVQGERPVIVQRTHHATMDGKGAVLFLSDVFRALRGETPLGAPSTVTDIELARALGGKKRDLLNTCLNPFASPSTGLNGSTWRRVTLENVALEKVLPRLILALSRLARRTGRGPVLIDIPVNLRSFFPEVRSTANLTGSVRLAVPPGATVESIDADLHAQIAAHREADALVSAPDLRFYPLGLLRRVAHSLERRAVQRNEFSPSAAVSNLGKLNMAEYSGGDFRATSCFIVPPAYDGVPLFLILSGGANGLDLCARAPVALASGGRLEGLLAEIGVALGSEVCESADISMRVE